MKGKILQKSDTKADSDTFIDITSIKVFVTNTSFRGNLV